MVSIKLCASEIIASNVFFEIFDLLASIFMFCFCGYFVGVVCVK